MFYMKSNQTFILMVFYWQSSRDCVQQNDKKSIIIYKYNFYKIIVIRRCAQFDLAKIDTGYQSNFYFNVSKYYIIGFNILLHIIFCI